MACDDKRCAPLTTTPPEPTTTPHLPTTPPSSAYLEQGNTKVLAVVTGPHEAASRVKGQHDRVVIRCEMSTAAFSSSERRSLSKHSRWVGAGVCESVSGQGAAGMLPPFTLPPPPKCRCRRAVETSAVISNAFESAVLSHLYPKSQIDIYVQVLQDDGGGWNGG